LTEVKGLIQINQKIQVDLLSSKENSYVSNIQDIKDRELIISIPTKGINPLALKNGDLIKVSFISDSTRYEFKTKVIGWRYDNIPMYALALPEFCKRIQLRKFVRIPTILEVMYAEVTDEGKCGEFVKSTSLDLSGGGIRLMLKKDLPADARLLLKINIPMKNGLECLELMGVVVRTLPDEHLKLFNAAVKFIDISRRQQDLIVRYTFGKMAEQRRLS
jgi:c-di-GMP-binding flagellar brake protein YcgR